MSEVNETRRTPQESAEYLARSLQENTHALERVRRRSRWMIAMIVALALTLGVVFKFNYDGAVQRCESGNLLRDDINAKFDAVSDFLHSVHVDDDEEGRQLLVLLSDDLHKRDCGDIDWTGAVV